MNNLSLIDLYELVKKNSFYGKIFKYCILSKNLKLIFGDSYTLYVYRDEDDYYLGNIIWHFSRRKWFTTCNIEFFSDINSAVESIVKSYE